jgi:hypothetical protein
MTGGKLIPSSSLPGKGIDAYSWTISSISLLVSLPPLLLLLLSLSSD